MTHPQLYKAWKHSGTPLEFVASSRQHLGLLLGLTLLANRGNGLGHFSPLPVSGLPGHKARWKGKKSGRRKSLHFLFFLSFSSFSSFSFFLFREKKRRKKEKKRKCSSLSVFSFLLSGLGCGKTREGKYEKWLCSLVVSLGGHSFRKKRLSPEGVSLYYHFWSFVFPRNLWKN